MAVITTNNILATIDLTSYKSLKDLYEDLLTLKKDVFADYERIIIKYNSSNQKKLVDELLSAVDIPEFFVFFEQTDQSGGIDFSFSDSFCIYPWINLRVSTVGSISPCCMNTAGISNLSSTTLKEAYHSNVMSGLRQSFLSGLYPSSCSACWKEESAGKPSMRQRAKHKFKDIYYRLDYQTEDIKNLQLFDLNLGNDCNLSCRICNRTSSSSIAKRDLADGVISTVEFQTLKDAVRWAETDEFWDQLLDSVQNIRYLDLYGGEPLMSKLHFKFLKRLIDLDVAKDIKIDYNSNGTVYSDKFFDLWQHFKEIKISFSIDDIGARFEQQRCGASWSEVTANIKQFNSMKSEKFITEVYPTVNTQNVLYLPELLAWIDTQEFDHVSYNILHSPYRYNILSLDHRTKQAVIDKLSANTDNMCRSIVLLLQNSIKDVDNKD